MTKKKLETRIDEDKHSAFKKWANENYDSMAAALRDCAEKAPAGRLHTPDVSNEELLERISDLEDKIESRETQQQTTSATDNTESVTDPNDNLPARGTGDTTVTGSDLVTADYSGEIALDDPHSPLYDPDTDVAINAMALDDWQNSPVVGGQYSDNSTDGKKGRKHVYSAVAHHLAEKTTTAGPNFTRHQFRSELVDHLGVPERTADDVLAKLVANGYIYADPTSPHGILTDNFLDEMRLMLADKTGLGSVEEAMTENEKKRWPADWRELLFGHDKVVNRVYYVTEEDYLNAVVDRVENSLWAITNKDTNRRKDPITSRSATITHEGQQRVWSRVSKRLVSILTSALDEFERDGDLFGEYNWLSAKALNLTPRDEGSDEWIDVSQRLNQFLDELRGMIERQVADDADDDVGDEVSIEDALDEMGFDEVPESEEDVTERFRQLAKDRHPDSGDLETSDEFMDLSEANDVLLDVVDGDPSTDAASSEEPASIA